MRTPQPDNHARPFFRSGHDHKMATADRLSREEIQALLADPCSQADESDYSRPREHDLATRHPPAHIRDSGAHARAARLSSSRFSSASQREIHALPAPIPFTKMRGLGKNYVYMEEFETPIKNPSALAVTVSDRLFGVGSDGLVLIGPSRVADFRMRIFNADGSETGMCSNAARCVGKYVFERGLTARHGLSLETLVGVRSLLLDLEGSTVVRVRLDMGKPRLRPSDLPVLVDGGNFINRKVPINGKVYRATAVSMGEPHLVVPFLGIDSLDLAHIGPQFEHHPLFPRGISAEFVEVRDRSRIRMRSWERGVGETPANGVGACAALVACALNGLTDYAATVEQAGGELYVEWDGLGEVFMIGGANFVCSGEYYLS